MERKEMTRWRASGLHLLFSIAIAAAVLALMLSLWYPGPLFEAAGGNDLLFILVGVNVVIGPLITLIIFRSGKWGLKFDLAVIAILQIGALIYGMRAVYLARPLFIVFVVDQFQVASAPQLDPRGAGQGEVPAIPPGAPRAAAAGVRRAADRPQGAWQLHVPRTGRPRPGGVSAALRALRRAHGRGAGEVLDPGAHAPA